MPAQWNPSQYVLEHIARKMPKRLGPGSWWEEAVPDEWTKRLGYHPQNVTSAQLEDIEDEGPQDEDSQSDDDHDDGQQDQGDQAGENLGGQRQDLEEQDARYYVGHREIGWLRRDVSDDKSSDSIARRSLMAINKQAVFNFEAA